MELYSNFSKNIKTLRTIFGETQSDLADYLNVSRSTIANYETGVSIPDLNKISAISYHYGCSIDTLLNDELPADILSENIALKFIQHVIKLPQDSFFTDVIPFYDHFNGEDAEFSKAVTIYRKLLINPAFVGDYYELENLFNDSYKIHGNVESLINLINLTIYAISNIKCNPVEEYKEDMHKLKSKTLTEAVFIKKYLLNNDDISSKFMKPNELDRKYLEYLYDSLENYIHILKHSNFEYKYDYIDYINTIMYLCNLQNNSNSQIVNQQIGIELFKQQLNSVNNKNNNIYCVQFLEKLNFL